MRTHGTLVKWNDELGFGFIQPSMGTEELFVHVSAFPRDGVRPRLNELVSFEVESREDGKKRAVRLMRTGSTTQSPERPDRRRPASTQQHPMSGWIGSIGLLLLAVMGYFSYAKLTANLSANNASLPTSRLVDVSKAVPADAGLRARTTKALPSHVLKPVPVKMESPAASFHCDGRKYCSQMTSCAEATYFLNRCPYTQMDGDHDGVACERQWCSGG